MTIVPWVTVKPANSLLPRADQATMAAEIPGARLVIYANVEGDSERVASASTDAEARREPIALRRTRGPRPHPTAES